MERKLAVLRQRRSIYESVTQPEMAGRLGRRKVQHVVDVAPEILATANPGCALQIANGLRAQAGHNIEVLHVVQLLDRAYANGTGTFKQLL